ncbi:hypothetical protein HHK36_011582 [Tetracentron sinense]|uniref:GrpE protein homolog n=1 Tax=Tetracentron sinense TaxID=13715 RepID=A0A834ZDZ6_TETSI|nr:hypothetical protein HHK36_011582 [Tetracentron sinense]
MATVLRTPAFLLFPLGISTTSLETPQRICFSLKQRCIKPFHINVSYFSNKALRRVPKFLPFAAYGESTETNEEIEETETQEISDGEVPVEDGRSDNGIVDAEEKLASAIMESLQSYKEALASNEKSKAAEIEAFFQSFEDEKLYLSNKVATLSEELSSERGRILRISVDFNNFRKRTERECLSLVTNSQRELVENLFPILDNFGSAKAQFKVETEGEEKINNSYQSIYKQFVEILGSLSVVPVETVPIPFNPWVSFSPLDL